MNVPYSYRSAQSLSIPENSKIVSNPESTELEDERFEGSVGFNVEGGVWILDNWTGHVLKVKECFIIHVTLIFVGKIM